jgi:hypothetical protein
MDAPVGMLLIRGHRIERANTAFAELGGMTVEALAGADPLVFVPPAEAGRVTRTLAAAALGRTPPAGDELLVRIGEALRSGLRESDILGRMGGDEFALILPDADAAGARYVARKLLDTVRSNGSVSRDVRRLDVTASIGITSLGAESKLDAAQLLIEADLAMYRAKAAGRDRIAVFAASERATAIHP